MVCFAERPPQADANVNRTTSDSRGEQRTCRHHGGAGRERDRRAVDRSGDGRQHRPGACGGVAAGRLGDRAACSSAAANAQPYILTLLSALAVIGVFSLFAGAAGILRFAGRETQRHVPRGIAARPRIRRHRGDRREAAASSTPTPAYLKLVDAVDADDVRPVERVFIGDPQVSEAIYRLAKASREGRPLQEEVRVPAADGGAARWLRFRVRPLQRGGSLRALDDVDRHRRDARPRRGRRTSSRNCSTRSITSIMRRPVSSRSIRRARSATSTRRWPAGSTTISRRSAPAG